MDIDGILLVDKDEGITSFEVVRKMKACLKVKKAGHTGTLDKAASGLLIVCINKATAVQSIFMINDKLYRAIISLGKETDTLDRHGRVVKEERVEEYSDKRVRTVLERYTGRISQIPPAYSAIRHKGERLYKKALRGEVPHIVPREVEIKKLRLLKNEIGEIAIEVCASKGTYIRSLARDIANSLGTCGHLASLRRLEIGQFSVEEALHLDEIVDQSQVMPLGNALEFLPQVTVNQEEAKMILNGFPPERIFDGAQTPEEEVFFRVLWGKRLIAIMEKGTSFKYFKVFGNYEVVHS